MLNCPLSLVVAEREKFVALFVAVTVAPTTTAPCGSVTVPSMLPVVACAIASGAKLLVIMTSETKLASHLLNLFFIGASSVFLRHPSPHRTAVAASGAAHGRRVLGGSVMGSIRLGPGLKSVGPLGA
jgi:hypothetical protein